MKLIIVESPTKAKTISKFLGEDYKVESSFGHIRDLPKSKLGIDTENDFEPQYIIPTKAKKAVSNLKKLSEKAEEVILASDEDREGEAIAWHLIKALNLKKEKIKRIVFHEITKNAITEALENPGEINEKMFKAQQARRVLDRLVGYKLSPFLWKKLFKGLSAGRVQSAGLRLIVEREEEIKAFDPQEYWSIKAFLNKEGEEIESFLNKVDGKTLKKLELKTKEETEEILENLKDAKYRISNIEQKTQKKQPPTPFTTSTLQQSANRMLGFSAKQTMMIAQQLYEGINTKKEGQTGLITYMRTDSLNLSQTFLTESRKYLEKTLGDKYVSSSVRVFKTKSKNAQEAHEAIRPTSAFKNPESLKSSLDPKQYKLYKLIWQRAVATQMPPAEINNTSLDIEANQYEFKASGQIIKFKGYLEIYPEKTKDYELPKVEKGEELELKELKNEQHFTKPPARYSDASLVKELEKYGIGRPSTYAPIISTLIQRNYVNRDDNKKLEPTEIAFIVINLLKEHFSEIVSYEFTAQMENNLDKVATGKTDWVPVIKEFYEQFEDNLNKKYEELDKKDIVPEEESKEICDKCGSKMVIKRSRFGKFLACSNFPDCKNKKDLKSETNKKNSESDDKIKELEEKYKGEVCEKCGSEMVIKNGKYGPFLACSNFPKCKNIKNIKENNNSTGITCPKCNTGEISKRFSKRGVFYGCSNYPACRNAYWSKPTGEKCPECDSLLIENKNSIVCSNKSCDYKK